MLRPLILFAIILALAAGIAAQPATAQEDFEGLAGYWMVWVSGSPCLLYLERDGNDLDGGWVCGATGNGQLDGTADGSEFSFSVVIQPTENSILTVDGVLSENERHLEGFWMFDTDLDKHPPVTGELGETMRSGPRWADMNCDHAVDSLDAYYLLTEESEACVQYLTRLAVPASNRFVIGGDVNLDGHRDSRDVLLILQFEAGLIARLPVLSP